MVRQKTGGTVVLEGGCPYLQSIKFEENLEKKLRRDPNTWMFTNV